MADANSDPPPAEAADPSSRTKKMVKIKLPKGLLAQQTAMSKKLPDKLGLDYVLTIRQGVDEVPNALELFFCWRQVGRDSLPMALSLTRLVTLACLLELLLQRGLPHYQRRSLP